MNKYVHALILVFFCLSFFTSFSQQPRINSSNVAKVDNSDISTSIPNNKNDNPSNKTETSLKSVIQNAIENKNISDTTTKLKATVGSADRMINKQHSQQRLTEKGEVIVIKQAVSDDVISNKIAGNNDVFQDNVTYTKEILPTDSKSNNVEQSSQKVTPSVNYKSKVLREDVTPLTNNTSNEISPNKRIYLQEEADDLQAEIALNRNNPNYNMVSKQKKLQQILDLLK
jgi:hypothetical protein